MRPDRSAAARRTLRVRGKRAAGAVPSGGSGADPFRAGIPTPGASSPAPTAGNPGAAAGELWRAALP